MCIRFLIRVHDSCFCFVADDEHFDASSARPNILLDARGNRKKLEKFMHALPSEPLLPFFSSSQEHFNANRVSRSKEFIRLLCPHFHVVRRGAEGNAHAFYFASYHWSRLSLLSRSFRLFVLPLPEVDNSADGRTGVGADFDEVESALAGKAQGRVGFHDAEVFPLIANDEDGGDADVLVHPWAAWSEGPRASGESSSQKK